MTHRPSCFSTHLFGSWDGVCHRNAWKWYSEWRDRDTRSRSDHCTGRHVRWKSYQKTLRSRDAPYYTHTRSFPYGSSDPDTWRNDISPHQTKYWIARYYLLTVYSFLKNMSSHTTYIVRCADDTLYTGYTNNLDKRLETHNSGK